MQIKFGELKKIILVEKKKQTLKTENNDEIAVSSQGEEDVSSVDGVVHRTEIQKIKHMSYVLRTLLSLSRKTHYHLWTKSKFMEELAALKEELKQVTDSSVLNTQQVLDAISKLETTGKGFSTSLEELICLLKTGKTCPEDVNEVPVPNHDISIDSAVPATNTVKQLPSPLPATTKHL